MLITIWTSTSCPCTSPRQRCCGPGMCQGEGAGVHEQSHARRRERAGHAPTPHPGGMDPVPYWRADVNAVLGSTSGSSPVSPGLSGGQATQPCTPREGCPHRQESQRAEAHAPCVSCENSSPHPHSRDPYGAARVYRSMERTLSQTRDETRDFRDTPGGDFAAAAPKWKSRPVSHLQHQQH
jgi:hypothetical protein